MIALTPATLARAGELLYGSWWQSELARALDVGPRRVREWLAGERSIPPGIWPEIAALLMAQSKESAALAATLQRSSQSVRPVSRH